VQACDHGGITIHADTGKAIACDLCQGEPKCLQSCPEEALAIVESDEEAEKRFNDALITLSQQIEKITTSIKDKDWKPFLAIAEKRSAIITEKLEALNKKAKTKK
jgi:Fe-S-cluster-containing dehydrogenase component